MSPGGGRGLVRLLLITCAMAGPSLSQECSAERMENSIIDIDLSLPRGVRGAEPLRVPGAGACVRACCSGHSLAGDKKCNLVIFYAGRTRAHPNCYLFHCPTTDACLMKPAKGLVSYRITTDTRAPEDKSIKTENFSSNEYSLSSDAEAFFSHSQDSPQNPTATLQQSVFHQASELVNHIGKHLDNIEFHTDFPESQRAEQSESLDSIPREKEINLPPNMFSAVQTGNPTASFPTTQSGAPETSSAALPPLPASTAQLEFHTTPLHPRVAKPAITPTTATSPPATASAAKPGTPVTSIAAGPLSTPTTSTTKRVTPNSRPAAAPSGLRTPAVSPEPTALSRNHISHGTLPSFSDSILSAGGSPASPQNDLQGDDAPDSEIHLSEGVLGGKGAVQLGEKSSLVAALLFGVVFLLLVIALTGKKIHESLQKRHYTRLDYLINGMYADA
ncbi:MANSC domain-containing protein 1 [Empidonax traillii]|uniref:MANSC domain-containing protein 1 n=1 Tax=Empidonax traillii TaxID=164674 RepID=UPI000FFD71FD|nr:MANSC domain-containing protein 1 [Empidonax traillii]